MTAQIALKVYEQWLSKIYEVRKEYGQKVGK